MLDTAEILRRLKALREAAGLKQEEMAERLGIDRTTFLRKEKGHIPITTEEWLLMADLLGKDTACFFTTTIDEAEDQSPVGDEKRLLSLYRTLNTEEQRDILFSIHLLLKGIKREDVQRELKRLIKP